MPEVEKTIYLIRHAQAEHNVKEEYHIPDAPLTQLGKQQAKHLIQNYPHLGQPGSRPEVIFTSPLIRTIQTTQIGLGSLDIPVIAVAELQENSAMPCDTGSDVAVIRQRFPDLDVSQVPEHWNSKTGPWEASQTALAARAQKLRDILAERQEDRLALVTHGGFCSHLVGSYTRFNNAECRQFQLRRSTQGQWVLVAATKKDSEIIHKHVADERKEDSPTFAQTEMPTTKS